MDWLQMPYRAGAIEAELKLCGYEDRLAQTSAVTAFS